MAATGENNWPSTGKTNWPLTRFKGDRSVPLAQERP